MRSQNLLVFVALGFEPPSEIPSTSLGEGGLSANYLSLLIDASMLLDRPRGGGAGVGDLKVGAAWWTRVG